MGCRLNASTSFQPDWSTKSLMLSTRTTNCVLPKTPSGKIMRRLLKEIMATGDVGSDLTALEDGTSIERLKALVRACR